MKTNIAIIGLGDHSTKQWYGAEHLRQELTVNSKSFRTLEAIDRFDANFWGMSAREAAAMDPQQRLLLETTWEAFEEAGMVPERVRGKRVGVFLGMISNEYYELQIREGGALDLYAVTGGSRNGAAGRLSHAFGFSGPSLVLDTDRSASLVAVHYACQSLLSGESDMAVAGGVNVILLPDVSEAFSRLGLLAPDGRCKFGDAKADGFVRSEGVGVVLLKRLEDAERDGDPIVAVIRGSYVSNTGGVSGDMMTPSVEVQKELIEGACQAAGVRPTELDYVEAHGPGTPVGDPVELGALGALMVQGGRRKDDPLYVGSVKTQIGHTEGAAGIMGLIHLATALRAGVIPPSFHFETPNPAVDFEGGCLRIPTTPLPWPKRGPVRLGGVSSFGLTGTNAHAVLSEWQGAVPVQDPTAVFPGPGLVVLSARSATSLHASAEALHHWLTAGPGHGASLSDLSHTTTVRRSHHGLRLACVAGDTAGLIQQLEGVMKGELGSGVVEGQAKVGRKTVFVFPGQGSQWAGMGKGLYETEPVFRETIDACEAAMRPYVSWSLKEELFKEVSHTRVHDNAVLQPTIFAVELALARLLTAWSGAPQAVLGHSMGEVAAMCYGGALSLEDAVRIMCIRSRLMATQSGKGRMALVRAEAKVVEEWLKRQNASEVGVATFNGPHGTVISGATAELEALVSAMTAAGVSCSWVQTDVACHSAQMEPLGEELLAGISGIRPRKGEVMLYSTVTTEQVKGESLVPEYWWRNLREPVRFADTVQRLLAEGVDTFIEVSPHPILNEPILDGIQVSGKEAMVVGTLKREAPERQTLLETLGTLYSAGVPVSFGALYGTRGHLVRLPTYPWDKVRCWYAQPEGNAARTVPRARFERSGSEPERLVLPKTSPAPSIRLLYTLSEAVDEAEREAIVLSYVTRDVAKVLGLDVGAPLDVTRPFRELGLKSAMAVELRAMLGKALGVSLPHTVIFNYPTVKALAQHLVSLYESKITSKVDASSRLGELLVSDKLISNTQLSSALRKQDKEGSENIPLGVLLVREGMVSQADLQRILSRQLSEPIAIVGLSCRFPGDIVDAPTLFRSLNLGPNLVCEIPLSRWDLDKFYSSDADASGKMSAAWAGIIGGIDEFDPIFFDISPAECMRMDPQQRLLLEAAWEAVEPLGPISFENLSRTGVFLGMMNYPGYASKKFLGEHFDDVGYHDGTGDANSIAAGRLSYILGAKGPAIAVDTACSSSLVSVHLACQSLLSGECSMALAGGVNLLLSPLPSIAYSKARMLASDGRCKTFDAAANGYVRGEGCAVFVLKRLSDAVSAHDPIHAILRATSVNQDGKTSGITVPNGKAQTDLIRDALSRGGTVASSVSYVEAHGTGTSLGDPIEIQAVSEAYGDDREQDESLALGSIKTNMGHLEASAGAAGVFKLIVAHIHEEIPSHLNLSEINPYINVEIAPRVSPGQGIPWISNSKAALGGISSFGFSGTNAHVLVERATASHTLPAYENKNLHQIITLSAKNGKALVEKSQRLRTTLIADAPSLRDLCYSVNVGSTHFGCRIAYIVQTQQDVVTKFKELELELAQKDADELVLTKQAVEPQSAFVFADSIDRVSERFKDLYDSHEEFKTVADQCDLWIQKILSLNILNPASVDDDSQLGRKLQIYMFECALYRLLLSWGVVPRIVTGWGVGEVAAGYAAGVFSLESGLEIIHATSTLADDDGIIASIGKINFERPKRAVVTSFYGKLADRRIGVHPQVKIDRRVLNEEVEDITVPAFWLKVTRNRPELGLMAKAIVAQEPDVLLMLGLENKLISLVNDEDVLRERNSNKIQKLISLNLLSRNDSTTHGLLLGLSELYNRGSNIRWNEIYRDIKDVKRVTIPSYPFSRKTYWLDNSQPKDKVDSEKLWSVLFKRGKEASRNALKKMNYQEEADKVSFLEYLGSIYAQRAISELHLKFDDGEDGDSGSMNHVRYLPQYRQLINRFFRGIARVDKQKTSAQYGLPSGAKGNKIEQLLAQKGWGDDGWVRLLMRCGEKLIGALQGEEDPRELLFPEGSFELVAGVYEKDAIARYCTSMVCSLVKTLIEAVPLESSIRVLEIGAGTGGTSSWVLPIFPKDRTVYVYTDVSNFFFQRAKERFRDYPFIEYKIFDAEKSPESQGLDSHSFDLIIAANVLHATKDLKETLSHVRKLLSSRGLLVLWEITSPSLLFDVTFGLVLQPLIDRSERNGEPFLSARRWKDLLCSVGFENVQGFSDCNSSTSHLGQHVILAEANRVLGVRYAFEGSSRAQEALTTYRSTKSLRRTNHYLVGNRLDLIDLVYAGSVDKNQIAWVEDHKVFDFPVVPAAAYLDGIMTGAFSEFSQCRKLELENVEILSPIALGESRESETVSTELKIIKDTDAETNHVSFELYSKKRTDALDETWVKNVCGDAKVSTDQDALLGEFPSLMVARAECQQPVDVKKFYDDIKQLGVTYGPVFQVVQELYQGEESFLAKVKLVELTSISNYQYTFHPALLDGCFQLLFGFIRDLSITTMVPSSIEKIQIKRTSKFSSQIWCYAKRRQDSVLNSDSKSLHLDLFLYVDDGVCLAEINGFSAAAVRRDTFFRKQSIESVLPDHRGVVPYQWGWEPSEISTVRDDSVKNWIVYAEDSNEGAELANELIGYGYCVLLLTSGDEKSIRDSAQLQVASLETVSKELIKKQLERAQNVFIKQMPCGVIFLPRSSCMGTADYFKVENGVVQRVYELSCALLSLIQGTLSFEHLSVERFIVVTRNAANALDTVGDYINIEQSPLWGIGKVLILEHPEVKCKLVGLNEADSVNEQLKSIAKETTVPFVEDHLSSFGGTRIFRGRLQEWKNSKFPENTTIEHDNTVLECNVRGDLDTLKWRAISQIKELKPGEVEIETKAIGLNFLDVMDALGVLPIKREMMGVECSGVVTRIGEHCKKIAVGDEVVVFSPNCFQSHVSVLESLVVKKSKHLDWESSASLPCVMLTAHIALNHLAKLKGGEKILVHAAAGGVGMAAVWLAKKLGAYVIGTAGSESKREFLKSIGVDEVYSSRSTEFTNRLINTNGEGCVDVVLNSLSGAYIPKSLEVLKRGGRFVEIGKTGIWTDKEVEQLQKDTGYFILDVFGLAKENPDYLGLCLKEIMTILMENNTLFPVEVFKADHVVSAFRKMQRAEHIGKIVVTPPEKQARWRAKPVFNQNSYLITGGLRGLGIHFAEYLIEKGTKSLVLVGKSQPSSESLAKIEEFRKKGVTILIRQCDVADGASFANVIQEVQSSVPVINGVIHSAGTLSDGFLLNQENAKYQAVYGPKVDGSWHLHTLTGSIKLEFFLLFSSVVGLIGAKGQSNHSAACSFEDGMAWYRRSMGMSAISINWGYWSKIGAAAERKADQHVFEMGMGAVDPSYVNELFDRVLLEMPVQVAIVGRTNWREYSTRLASKVLPMFLNIEEGLYVEGFEQKIVRRENKDALVKGGDGKSVRWIDRISDLSQEAIRKELNVLIKQELSAIMELSIAEISDTRALMESGLDSLMAVEFRNRLSKKIEQKLPPTLIFTYPTVSAIGDFIASKVCAETQIEKTSAVKSEPIQEGQTSSKERSHSKDSDFGIESLLSEVEAISDEDAGRIISE